MTRSAPLRYGIQLDCLRGMPRGTGAPRVGLRRRLGDDGCRQLAAAGLDVVQATVMTGVDPGACARAGLALTAAGTWGLVPGDGRLEPRPRRWRDAGMVEAAMVVGSPVSTEAERRRRVEELLATSDKVGLPVHIETHRSSITQDLEATCALAEQYPELTFNLDYSHWFFAHGLWRSPLADVVEQLAPVLRRTAFVQLRVSSPDEVQTPTSNETWTEHFLAVWEATARLSDASRITVVSELLPSYTGYAARRADRWDESLRLIARLRDRVAA